MAQLTVLETKRLIICPFKKEHISNRYIGWLNDTEVVRFSQQRFSKHTAESCALFMESFENSPNHFSALVSKDEQIGHIGNISTTVDVWNKVADISILIGEKSIWGKGYGAEAWSEVMKCLLGSEGFRMVTGGCMANNARMVRIMEKSGMKSYYTRKGYFLCGEGIVDSVHYKAERM